MVATLKSDWLLETGYRGESARPGLPGPRLLERVRDVANAQGQIRLRSRPTQATLRTSRSTRKTNQYRAASRRHLRFMLRQHSSAQPVARRETSTPLCEF